MKVENSKHNKTNRISIVVLFTIVLIPSLFSLTRKFILSAKEKANTSLFFEKIEIEFENIYSKALESEIREFAKNQIQKNTLLSFDQNKFYKNLKSTFHIIKQFECHINSLSINLKIVGVKPYCTVNNNWVMGNKKHLFPINLFDQFNFSDIKNISVRDKSFNNPHPKDLYIFINSINSEYWQSFEIDFAKSTEIYLTPKTQALNYCFLTDQKTIFDKLKLTKAQELYKKLMLDENFIKKMKTKKNNKFVLDLRFRNRIVTSFVATNTVETKLEDNGREGGI
jgi:hypothetical protein